MLGPAGTGKSMMAKALPGILPGLTADEAIEITRIYSAAGMLPPGQGLIASRPVRTPHHTASMPAIVGGGATVPLGDRTLTLSTGPLRLAAHTNAAVIPCVAREKWWWRGGVSIADPLPDSLLHDHPKACAGIARTLMRWIRQDPFQCSDILLNQFGTGPAQT